MKKEKLTLNRREIRFGFKNISLKSGVGFKAAAVDCSANLRVLRKISLNKKKWMNLFQSLELASHTVARCKFPIERLLYQA